MENTLKYMTGIWVYLNSIGQNPFKVVNKVLHQLSTEFTSFSFNNNALDSQLTQKRTKFTLIYLFSAKKIFGICIFSRVGA